MRKTVPKFLLAAGIGLLALTGFDYLCAAVIAPPMVCSIKEVERDPADEMKVKSAVLDCHEYVVQARFIKSLGMSEESWNHLHKGSVLDCKVVLPLITKNHLQTCKNFAKSALLRRFFI